MGPVESSHFCRPVIVVLESFNYPVGFLWVSCGCPVGVLWFPNPFGFVTYLLDSAAQACTLVIDFCLYCNHRSNKLHFPHLPASHPMYHCYLHIRLGFDHGHCNRNQHEYFCLMNFKKKIASDCLTVK